MVLLVGRGDVKVGRKSKTPKPMALGDDQAVVRLISERYEALSPKLQLVAHFFMQNPRMASYASVHEVADRLGVNAATVVRFAKAMGFEGYADWRQNLRQLYLRTIRPEELVDAQRPAATHDPIRAMIQQDLNNLQTLAQHVDADQIRNLARLIVRSERTLVAANGAFAAIAILLSQQCSSMGLKVDYHIRGGASLAARAATLTPRDLLIGITFWRGNRDTVQVMEWAKEHGVPTAAISDSKLSPVAKAADLVLVAPSEGALFFQSMTAPLSLVYALVVGVWEEAGPSAEEGARRLQDLYRKLGVLHE